MEDGRLVPDDIMVPLVAEGLPASSQGKGGGYILDGFPRTVSQARALNAMLAARGLGPIQRAVNIELEDWVRASTGHMAMGCSAVPFPFCNTHFSPV